MVATRRGARTGPPDELQTDDATLTLRKKPVRRATASTTAKAVPSAPKTRATRATKATKATEQVEPGQEDGEDELQSIEEAPAEPKPTTTRATRAKKGETVAPEPTRKTRTTKPASQPKRSTRAATVKPTEEPQEIQEAPVASTKPTLAAKPARQTRAKAPAAQSPLSPKKITQVSRVRTRGANSTEEEKPKPATRTRAATGTRQSRTTRKRAVSDENAEVAGVDRIEDATAEIPSLPPKVVSPRRMSPQKQPADEDVDQMSSGETTPSEAPGASFEQPKDTSEDNKDAADLEDTDGDTETAENSASDDELCGPKTPMRRVQKAQSQYHNSESKTAQSRDPDVPLQTPPRRYGPHGATRATPQTQKPFGQPAVAESATRPMTVARADNRPFVFRKLQDDLKATPKMNVPEMTLEEQEKETKAELEEQDEVPTPNQEKEHPCASEKPKAEDSKLNHPEEERDDDLEKSEIDLDETIVVDEIEEGGQSDVEMEDSPTAQPPVASYEVEESMVDVDSSVMEPPMPEYELDDDTMDMDPPVASYELDLDGSIIIHSRGGSSDAEEDSEDEDIDRTEFGLKTPRPQTIPWQNIRDDTTIPVDFDLHFADVRSPARTGNDFTFGNTSSFSNMQLDDAFDFSTLDGNIEGVQTRDPTMNMNDFIDMAALVEPTLQSGAFAGVLQEERPEGPQDGSLLDASAVTDDTVIVTRDESPMPSPTAPAHENEQSSHSPATASTPRIEMLQEQATTPVMETEAVTTAPSQSADVLEEVDDELVPHYALPTLSSRRKSLPALGSQTPVNMSSRPITSDGHSIARVTRPFDRSITSMSRRSSVVDSSKNVAKTESGSVDISGISSLDTSSPLAAKTPAVVGRERFPRRTPKDSYNEQPETRPTGTPSRFQTPDRTHMRKFTANKGETPQPNTVAVPFRFRTPTSTKAQRPATVQRLASQAHKEVSVPTNATVPVATPQERYPRRSERQRYNEHASTVAAPSRFHTPIQGKSKRPATAQRLASQSASHDETPPRFKAQATPKAATPQAATPEARFPRLPSKRAYDELAEAEAVPLPATPQPRFPRLPPKQTYDERAATVVGPSRFRSPAHASPRRPMTSQKPVNLRKVALKSSAPGGSHTPIKTPLKAPAMTPSQVPMTPHPGAPLRGVLALVEVFTLDGASASAPFISLLQRLGAKTTKSWSERVTHVIFKDGSPTTLQRVRLNNKEVESSGKGFPVHCVNSRWVSDCDATGSRVDEDDDAYAVDVTEVPRGGGRRRKSMEPSALINIGGNIVRDRKSSGRQSIGFSSLGRSSMKADSSSSDKKPEDEDDVRFATPAGLAELRDENFFDGDDDGESELATPDYLAAPDKLLQMTAPVNRVRKLDFKKDEGGKNRRLTSFWEGGE